MEDRPITLGIANSSDAAYEQGYNDFFRSVDHDPKSLLNPAYNPPAGREESYKAGWEAARSKQTHGRGGLLPEI